MSRLEFDDDRLAALYDRFSSEERDDFAFYLPLIRSARAVLDVGCGTGALLKLARDAGHTGRLCGLDPSQAMLNQARERSDIEWVHGDLTTVAWDRAFDLIVMTGHAFQELIEDDQIRTALAGIRAALTDDGRFAFETRNPLVRGWERWSEQYSGETTDSSGATVRAVCELDRPVTGHLVNYTFTYTSPAWPAPLVSASVLRFVDAPTLARFLAEAGLAIEEQYGDWQRGPLTATSPEIITIARQA